MPSLASLLARVTGRSRQIGGETPRLRRDRDLTCLHASDGKICVRVRGHEGNHDYRPLEAVKLVAPPGNPVRAES